jgi:hypothetical protein
MPTTSSFERTSQTPSVPMISTYNIYTHTHTQTYTETHARTHTHTHTHTHAPIVSTRAEWRRADNFDAICTETLRFLHPPDMQCFRDNHEVPHAPNMFDTGPHAPIHMRTRTHTRTCVHTHTRTRVCTHLIWSEGGIESIGVADTEWSLIEIACSHVHCVCVCVHRIKCQEKGFAHYRDQVRTGNESVTLCMMM